MCAPPYTEAGSHQGGGARGHGVGGMSLLAHDDGARNGYYLLLKSYEDYLIPAARIAKCRLFRGFTSIANKKQKINRESSEGCRSRNNE